MLVVSRSHLIYSRQIKFHSSNFSSNSAIISYSFIENGATCCDYWYTKFSAQTWTGPHVLHAYMYLYTWSVDIQSLLTQNLRVLKSKAKVNSEVIVQVEAAFA